MVLKRKGATTIRLVFVDGFHQDSLGFLKLTSNKLITSTDCNRKEIDRSVVRDNNISCVWHPTESCKVLNSFHSNLYDRNLSKQTSHTNIECQ